MPKKFSRAVKDRAFKLYITDEYSVPEIAQQVSAEHRTVVNAQTIYAWVRQDDWKIKKVEVKANGTANDLGTFSIGNVKD